ncbi:MAG: sigma-54-dependent transcriptional regulator [bacterium]
MQNIFIVDDDQEFVDSLKKILGKDYSIEIATNPEEARKMFAPLKYDVVLLDICFDPKTQDRKGVEILGEIKSLDPDIPVIMMTAYSNIDTAIETLKMGAEDYIQKNKASLSDYKNKIDFLLREGRLRRKVSRLKQEILKYEPSEIIGKDPKIEEVKTQIKLVAQEGKTTVLILGETGTGKELVARAIHRTGIRNDGPFVTVSLASLNKETISSDLFGHEKGAYTGAVGRRIGFIEEADGGILFLDEIGDLEPDIQVKLLRVIENREFMRMGSNKPIKVDIQLVTATHRNLEKLIKENKFREDLYYRLKTYVIELPPLRERKGDIPLLANYFLEQLIRQGRSTAKKIDPSAMELLIEYDWPGNVRELKQAIENGVLNARLEGDESITLKHLKSIPKLEQRNEKADHRKEMEEEKPQREKPEGDIAERLAVYELNLVREALAKTGGKKLEVCKLLGYKDRFALRRRIITIFKKFPDLKEEFAEVFERFRRGIKTEDGR